MINRAFNLRSFGFLAASVVLFVALGFLQACGTNQVITTLETVVTASETALNVLAATGAIPAATVTIADAYLKSVDQAAVFAAQELQSSDSPALKITKIVQQFAMIAQPNLPPGTAQTIVSIIQAVTTAVENFLKSIQPASATAAAKIPNFKFSASDLERLKAIQAKAESQVQTLNRRP